MHGPPVTLFDGLQGAKLPVFFSSGSPCLKLQWVPICVPHIEIDFLATLLS